MPDVFHTNQGIGVSKGIHYIYRNRFRITVGVAASGGFPSYSATGSFVIKLETELPRNGSSGRLSSKLTGFGDYRKVHMIYKNACISVERGDIKNTPYEQIEVSSQFWNDSDQPTEHIETGVGWLRTPEGKEDRVYGYQTKQSYPGWLRLPINRGIMPGVFGTKVFIDRTFRNRSESKRKTKNVKIEAKKVKSFFKIKKLKIERVQKEVSQLQPIFSYQSIRLVRPQVQPIPRSYAPLSTHQIVIVVITLVALSRVFYGFGKRIFYRLRELLVCWKTKRSFS